MFHQIDNTTRNWSDFTLFVPAVSVGNIGQLTADLLISTLWMNKVGYIVDDSILPAIGNDPFAHPQSTTCKLVTNCQVYESASNQIMTIQQRAPFVQGRRNVFCQRLAEWICQCKFKQVVILTSSFAHERLDSQITGSQFRYFANPKMKSRLHDLIDKCLHWHQLEGRFNDLEHTSSQGSGDCITDLEQLYIPGSGIAKTLLKLCNDEVPVVVMMLYCSEGDNAQDAISLANHINDWMKIVDLQSGSADTGIKRGPTPRCWKIPSSWSKLFGNKADPTLFH